MKYVDFGFDIMENLSDIYKKVEPIVKQKIIRSIFPERLIFEDNNYRTPKVNDALHLISNHIGLLKENRVIKKDKSDDLSFKAARRGRFL